MTNFKSDKIERVDLSRFTELLQVAIKRTIVIVVDSEKEYYKIRSTPGFYFTEFSVIIEYNNKFDLVTKYGNEQRKPQRYRLLQPDTEDSEEFLGGRAYSIMQKSCAKWGEKIPSIRGVEFLHNQCKWLENDNKYFLSASPLVDFNKKFNKSTITGVWSYDLNSAYSSVIVNEGIPDVTQARYFDVVKPGEIGFDLDCHLTLIKPGKQAEVIMPLVKNIGLEKFCIHWFLVKKNSPKGSKERDKAKFYLNASIGMLQKYNPFVRAYIVNRCTEKIVKILDDDCILWNTDGFYTTKRRTDLNIGNGIGQFKEEYIETFRLDGCTYQKNEEIPVWRGVEKTYFKQFAKDNGRPFILNQDELPDLNRRYVLNRDTLTIKEITNVKN